MRITKNYRDNTWEIMANTYEEQKFIELLMKALKTTYDNPLISSLTNQSDEQARNQYPAVVSQDIEDV